MIFRDANINDHKAIVEFQQKMALETEHFVLNNTTVSAGVFAVLNDSLKGKYHVVEDNGKVISSLLTTFEWSDWRNARVIWIQSVYVLNEYRERGVFKYMYDEIKKMVQSNSQYAGIRLYVDRTNEKAIKVYKSMGMESEHYLLFEDMKVVK